MIGNRRRLGWLGVAAVAVIAILAASLLGLRRQSPAPPAGWTYPGTGQLPTSLDPDRWRALGPASCVECHADAVAAWQHSTHDRANRPLHARNAADLAPFLTPSASYQKDGEAFQLLRRGDEFLIAVTRPDGSTVKHPVVGLIGVDPLVNFLTALPDGRIQATTLAWDVHRKELFDTFDGDERKVGDYGHWLGQGLNWNANCAWCHMTDYRKNLDIETLGYRSHWLAQGVSCQQCHPGSEEHVRAQRSGSKDHRPTSLAIEQVMDNCLSCHSRRSELTANRFQPGEAFADHFSLSLPDQPGLYFADGQILDEVFAGASLRLSAMGHAGVTCMDCHNPHSLALTLPASNNALCLQCHGPGVRGARVVDPATHAFHHPLSEGGRCVDCHMPQRTYMSRDPRHDHGFPIPDPFLTLELGVPNACSQCHKDQSVEWAAGKVVEWYGEGFHERRAAARERARLFAAAHAGTAAAAPLVAASRTEQNPAWRAALTGLLRFVEPSAAVRQRLHEAAGDADPAVRERSASLLAELSPQDPALDPLLTDPRRSVRLAALQAEPRLADRSASLSDEWQEYLAINADRPHTAFLLARQAFAAGDLARMQRHLDQAVGMVPNEAEAWRQKAILHHEAGQHEQAARDLRHALQLEPDNPQSPFTLALFLAEIRDLDGAVLAFRQTLDLDPAFPRARYNLVVALTTLGHLEEARHQLQSGLLLAPRDPDLLSLQRWLQSLQHPRQAP